MNNEIFTLKTDEELKEMREKLKHMQVQIAALSLHRKLLDYVDERGILTVIQGGRTIEVEI